MSTSKGRAQKKPTKHQRSLEKSRHIKKSVMDTLLERSGGICECCGAAGSPDRHHLREYSLGGEHTPENLLLLCPSCHRQIPRYLSEPQQHQLQAWHQANIGLGNLSSIAQLRAVESSIDIGTVKFLNVRNVLRAHGQNIITLHKEESGFFMNVVMLEDFEPKLLVLSNKVIVNDGFDLQTSREEVIVEDANGDIQFRVTGDPVLTLRGQVRMKDERFLFSDEGFQFRGLNMKYANIDCAGQDFVAIDVKAEATELNIGGARILGLGRPDPSARPGDTPNLGA